MNPVEGILKRHFVDEVGVRPSKALELRSLVEWVQRPFSQLFRVRHPGRYDFEFGSWREPHINLTPDANVSAPVALATRPGASPIRVYCYVSIRAERCTMADQLEALRQAQSKILQYAENALHCDEVHATKTIKSRWLGITCSFHDTLAGGGALFEFSCSR